MEASKSDIDFDSYWDEEARNPNRNRIRIGRQYQAQVPPLLKSDENDGRKLEDLETLSWKPHTLTDFQLDHYFAIAKSIGLFVQALDSCYDSEPNECLEEEKCCLRPFEIPEIGTKNTLKTKSNNPSASVPSGGSPEKQSITTRQQRSQQKPTGSLVGASVSNTASGSSITPQTSKDEPESSSSSSSTSSPVVPACSVPLKQANTRLELAMRSSLSSFIGSHHPSYNSAMCACPNESLPEQSAPIKLGSSESYNKKTLSKLLLGNWSPSEAKIFSKAMQMCGKNFSEIKKDFLPWKSVRSIIEYYYCTLDKKSQSKHRKRKMSKSAAKSKQSSQKSTNTNEDKKEKGSSSSSENENSDANLSDDNLHSSDISYNKNSDYLSDDDDSSPRKGSKKRKNTQQADGGRNSSSLVNNNNTTGSNGESKSSESSISPSKNKSVNGNSMSTTAAFNNTFLNEFKRKMLPGNEVKPIKGKPMPPIDSTQSINPETVTANGGNSTLGSLNLYLHGELVLKLNAQKRDSGQKWVESMEAVPKKKRALNNGLSRSAAPYKRNIQLTNDTKPGHFFKEEPDDLSVGGDGSGSDDDSLTSNESSSLIASSPSSSSTITSAAKKARVKVENLSSLNGNMVPSPNSNSRKSDLINNGYGKHRTVSPSVIDTEAEMSKKILENNLSFLRQENALNMLFGGALPFGLFEPPVAHSNTGSTSNSSNLFSPSKTTSSKAESSSTATSTNSNNSNGFSNGQAPVDLTRKSSSDLSDRIRSPAASPSKSKQSKEHPTLSPHRLLSNSLGGLFSLPAPPPPTVVSPNGVSKTLKKSLMRTAGGIQYAK